MPDSTAVRARLEQELQVLERRHKALDAHLHNADRELPSDWDDKASVVGHDEVLESLDEKALSQMQALRTALERLDAGEWGVCVACGEDIAEGRLEALPSASRCAGCQALRE